jgi:membrane-associated phospholipid phosphatase
MKDKHPPISKQLFYILSSSELVLFYILILYTITNFNLYGLILMSLIILKTVVLNPIKKFVANKDIGKRPTGAFNCNMMNCGGKPFGGGFPSGHLAILGIAIMIIIQAKNKKIRYLYAILVVSTAMGRYYTKCHTILQIISGLIIGLIAGYGLYLIDIFIENNVEIYKKHKDDFYNSLDSIS